MDHVVSHQGLLASIENLGCTAQFPPLSPRERSILTLIGYGQSDKEIAKGLGIAPETVNATSRTFSEAECQQENPRGIGRLSSGHDRFAADGSNPARRSQIRLIGP